MRSYSTLGRIGDSFAVTTWASASRSWGGTSTVGASAYRAEGDSSMSMPVVMMRSTSPNPRSSKSRAWSPHVPRWYGLSHANSPFAPQVFATPTFAAAANACSPATASGPACTMRGPASTTRRRAPSIASRTAGCTGASSHARVPLLWCAAALPCCAAGTRSAGASEKEQSTRRRRPYDQQERRAP